MGYVLVPVPTEFVLEVMRWVLFRSTDDPDQQGEPSADRVERLLTEVDDVTRRMLVLVARSTAGGEAAQLRDLADELEIEPSHLRDVITALNESQPLDDGRDVIEIRADVNVGVHGKRGTSAFVSMRPDVAPVVAAVARSSAKQQ